VKKYFISIIILLSFAASAAQQAVTDEGEIVILKSNGTWEYKNKELAEASEILLNENSFTKGKKATFTLKSKINNSEFSFDPKAWSFEKAGDEVSEYTFKLKAGDLYGMAITESIEIDLPNLSQLALANAKSVAPDARIVRQEYRIVNGNEVMYLEFEGTISSINFKYLGYYYSNELGSTQYLVYTGAKVAGRYKSEIEQFLNGFSTRQL
jgi:hypothetical protein